jgi:LysR family transcriptional regulator for metE and metH
MHYIHVMEFKLEIRHLRSIVAISEAGGLTGAGRVLHLTQSALSHQLRDIGERLDSKLFVRVGHRMVATPAGERMVANARKILMDLRSAELQLLGEEGGLVRISTECHTCYHWLPAVMAEVRKKFPKLEIQIDVAATRHPMQSVLAGELDLALVSFQSNNPLIRETPLFTDELRLVVSPRHCFAKRSVIQLQDLATQTVVIYPPRSESSLLALLRIANVQPQGVVEMPLTEAIIEIVRTSDAVGFLAQWAAVPYVAAGQIMSKRITTKGLHREWSAATRSDRALTPQVAEFIRLLKRYPFSKGVRS